MNNLKMAALLGCVVGRKGGGTWDGLEGEESNLAGAIYRQGAHGAFAATLSAGGNTTTLIEKCVGILISRKRYYP